VVHRHLSSIVVVPSHLLFPGRLSFVVPSVVCHLRRRTALVHPQSTRRAVARQRGGGCSVDRHHRPCHCRCPHRSSSSPVLIVILSFVLVVRPRRPHPHPRPHHHRSSLSSHHHPRPCCLSLLFVLIVPVLVIVPPTVHPTSSCS
jgi:hypothetical protein